MSHPLTAAANADLFIVSAVLYSCAGYGPSPTPRAAPAMHRRALRTQRHRARRRWSSTSCLLTP
jgi:hypothetical protein